jgi:hypothetical protein
VKTFATTIGVLGAAWLLAGCATVTTGTTQPINIDSEPQQAMCTLMREGQELGTVTTPAPLTIKRHASTIQVICRKPGYEDGRVVMNSRYETASAGNFLLGGVIGVMVDASTGANSRYESNVLVRLAPMSPADQAAAAKANPQTASTSGPFAMPAAATTASAATPTVPPPQPKPVETTVAAAAPPSVPTGLFDGDYRGGLQLGALSPGNSYQRVSEALRSIEVHVVNGEGTGTVRQQRCSGIGAVSLKIAPNGAVSGEMDALETDSCAPLKVRIDAKVDRELITGVATNSQASVEFSMRKAN